MEKKKINIAAKMPCKLAMSHIECFLEGLRSGTMTIEQEHEQLVLHPHAEVQLNINAQTVENKQHLTITLDWEVPEEQHLHGSEQEYEHHQPTHPQESFHEPDEHGFHAHYHCHGHGEHQLCHSHEHSEGHHTQHQHVGCCEDVPHFPHKGCCAEHHYGEDLPEEYEVRTHGYRGCCEDIEHTPHIGCCSEHNYGISQTRQRRGTFRQAKHGRRVTTTPPAQYVEAIAGEGYKVWHKGHDPYFDHKHPQHFTPHRMFHGKQTHHKPHGKGENYHRSHHTAFPTKPHKNPAKQ